MKTLYFDYSATTPVDPRVAAKMIPYLTEEFGNPASRSHPYGWTADKAVEKARAAGRSAGERRPEGNRLDIRCDRIEQPGDQGRGAFLCRTKGKHIITVRTEHKAVLDTVRELERQGFEATYLDPAGKRPARSGQTQAAIAPRYRAGVGDAGEQRDRRDSGHRCHRRDLP